MGLTITADEEELMRALARTDSSPWLSKAVAELDATRSALARAEEERDRLRKFAQEFVRRSWDADWPREVALSFAVGHGLLMHDGLTDEGGHLLAHTPLLDGAPTAAPEGETS